MTSAHTKKIKLKIIIDKPECLIERDERPLLICAGNERGMKVKGRGKRSMNEVKSISCVYSWDQPE